MPKGSAPVALVPILLPEIVRLLSPPHTTIPVELPEMTFPEIVFDDTPEAE